MVCAAVRQFGGVAAPSLARPMLQSANNAFLAGRHLASAVLLREALRRALAAECLSSRIDAEGDARTLLERLDAAGVKLCRWYDDLLVEIDDVLNLRSPGKSMRFTLEVAFTLIGQDNRKGGAL